MSLTLMIIGCLAAIFWCNLALTEKKSSTFLDVPVNSERTGPCKDGYVYIPVACLVMLYLVYLVECWHSHTRLELRYKCDIATVYQTVNKMQAALPVIWWKAICYHYVRRTRQVMRYRNGDAFTSTQVYYERVDSSTAGAAFNFTQCGVKDISRPLSDLEQYTAVKIKVSKGFSFSNMETEFQFEEQRARFFQEHETKDDYMEGREGMDLMNVDFKEYMVAFRDPDNLPWYISPLVFWLASACLMSWPLRTIIELQTAHLHYHVHKLFGSNFLEGDSQPAVLSRVSTMNSSEFEMSIRNNNVIVPSYSEVMLSDVLDQSQQRHYGTIKTCRSILPRSLTNVALATRTSSSTKRSSTPTVTMNRVKKFKSCSTFGTSEYIEQSCNSSSVRSQIQQLLRDRGRLQSKRTAISQCSISRLSLTNGSVRFQIGTPGTPDDAVMRASFSCHSVTSPKNEIPSDVAVSGGKITNFAESSSEDKVLHGACNIRPSQFNNSQTSHCISINRSQDVQTPTTPENDNPRPQTTAQGTSLTPVYTGQAELRHIFPLLPVTEISSPVPGVTTDHITPHSPSPPPIYEQAISMRRLLPAVVTTPAMQPSYIEPEHVTPPLGTTSAQRHVAARTETGRHRADKRSNAPRVNNPSGQQGNSRIAPVDASNLESSQQLGESWLEEQQHNHHFHNRHRHHHQHRRPQRPVFKVLPKVSPSKCDDSQDSDTGYLHTAPSNCTNNAPTDRLQSALSEHFINASERKCPRNTHPELTCLPSFTSQARSLPDESISCSTETSPDPNGARDVSSDPSTSPESGSNTSTPSAAESTSPAELVATTYSSTSGERHHETSV